MTVSIRSALPCLRYCLTRECLSAKSIFTSVPGPKDPGAEGLFGGGADLAGEQDGDLGGAADAEVVGHQGLKEAAGAAWVVEDDRAAHLDLAHGQRPPVAPRTVGVGQRGRDLGHPAVEEALDLGRAEPVADRLQLLGQLAGSKPLASSVTARPALAACRLAHSCPLSHTLAG